MAGDLLDNRGRGEAAWTWPSIHPEGRKFGIIALGLSLVFAFLAWETLAWPLAFLSLGIMAFFRDPERVVPQGSRLILAPADGLVTLISQVSPPRELRIDDGSGTPGLGDAPVTRISIFMSVFDVHINRSPVGGTVRRVVYIPGKFMNADLDKASEENERQHFLVEMGNGMLVGFTQIAGLVLDAERPARKMLFVKLLQPARKLVEDILEPNRILIWSNVDGALPGVGRALVRSSRRSVGNVLGRRTHGNALCLQTPGGRAKNREESIADHGSFLLDLESARAAGDAHADETEMVAKCAGDELGPHLRIRQLHHLVFEDGWTAFDAQFGLDSGRIPMSSRMQRPAHLLLEGDRHALITGSVQVRQVRGDSLGAPHIGEHGAFQEVDFGRVHGDSVSSFN